mgnify:CR=1 FL=1
MLILRILSSSLPVTVRMCVCCMEDRATPRARELLSSWAPLNPHHPNRPQECNPIFGSFAKILLYYYLNFAIIRHSRFFFFCFSLIFTCRWGYTCSNFLQYSSWWELSGILIYILSSTDFYASKVFVHKFKFCCRMEFFHMLILFVKNIYISLLITG